MPTTATKPATATKNYGDGLSRLCAPNPGLMTGDGTNTWFIETDQGTVVIDPGPAIDSHIDAIQSLHPKIALILATHTHNDHSPAAWPLAEKTGAQVWGMSIADDGHQDIKTRFDKELEDGELITVGDRSIRVVHTPGHVGNHLCFLDERTGAMMVGDHLMNGSTVVIIPPSGDMLAYIESLQKILALKPKWLGPGHGERIEQAEAVVEHTIKHRLTREEKVFSALSDMGRSTLDQLVVAAYDDVDPSIHAWAKLSLHAHLLKLSAEGRVIKQVSSEGEQWQVR